MQTIVWAVNPFLSMPVAKSRHLISAINRLDHLKVEPVAIVSPKELPWPQKNPEAWEEKFRGLAEKSLRPVMRRARIVEMKEPTVLLEPSSSRMEGIRRLIDFAREQNAKMILVSMRSRKGFGRFRVGGFTESLMQASTIPVLTVRPDTRVPSKIKQIAFPSDLTADSRKVFLEILTLAKDWGAKVVILHRLEIPEVFAVDWVGFAAAAEIESMREVMRENELLKNQRGIEWMEEARGMGVDAEFRLLRGLTGLPQAIVKSSADSDLIAVTTQDHNLTQSVLGSAAKEVLRLSPRPVLVLQGKKSRENKNIQ